MVKYCTCGNRIEYSIFTPPTACPLCKAQFSLGFVPHSPPIIPKNPQVVNPKTTNPQTPADNDPDEVEIPQIDSFKLDIDASVVQKERFGAVVGTFGGGRTGDGAVRPAGKRVSKKKFLEEWKKEAGTARPNAGKK